MRKLSLWAKGHKKMARITIVVSFIALTALGIATGSLLSELGITLTAVTLLAFVAAYFTGVIFYPIKFFKGNQKSTTAFYVRQKSCDWLLTAATFCMIVYFGNRPNEIFNFSPSVNATIPATALFPKDSSIKAYKTITAFKASLKDETGKSFKLKERKKLLKEQIGAIKKDKDMSNGGKVALIVLSVVVALGLLYLVAALSCSLSCGGSEGAAVLVMIGGAGLIVFLLVMAIRAILGKKKKLKKTDIAPEEPAKTGS